MSNMKTKQKTTTIHPKTEEKLQKAESRMGKKNHLFDLKWLLFCLSLEELKQMTS